MKKLISLILSALLLLTVFVGCSKNEDPNVTPTPTQKADAPTATEAPKDITEKTDYVTEQWIAVEIPFTATETVKNFTDAVLDVTFVNRSTGTSLTMPGFWDGGKDWKVRFAPTECGIWDYTAKVTGETNIGIDGVKGTVAANAYKGELAIYKHGFVKTVKDVRYFVYDDGTPFFYLGDTHWNMPAEEFDSAGSRAKNIQTDSHFKYIVDRRVAQGFTVYQSEPIGASYDVSDGKISENDVKGFKSMDRYFKYIADSGLVHANAELIFPSSATKQFRENVDALTRYWVARYGAYPVMWTLGQEVDDGNNYREVEFLTFTYITMCESINKYDPYVHPLSAHQLNAANFTCKGNVPVAGIDYGSSRLDITDTKRDSYTKPSVFLAAKGHNWWASQWRASVHTQFNFEIPRDYWLNGSNKPIVDYEARYHYLSASDFGARVQAWIPYLTGMYGHGYGAHDIWLYKSDYDIDVPAYDGVETISVETKKATYWSDMVDAPIANELAYMRGFFENVGWWKLIPDFDDGNAFKKVDGKEGFYAAAYDGNDVYVVYLYNRTVDSAGKLVNMDKNATYIAQWFDTRTGQYTLIDYNLKADANGEYDIPSKPVADDMVLLVTKK